MAEVIRKFHLSKVHSGQVFRDLKEHMKERIECWREEGAVCTEDSGTTFGWVLRGHSELQLPTSSHRVCAGCYFSAVGDFRIQGGRGILVRIPDYIGLNVVGGPIEPTGRLRYIDGCTDTLVIAPPRLGEPCLNTLYFPPGVSQTFHTHPSCRIGTILRGAGKCETDAGEFKLTPGDAFVIPPELGHRFCTDSDELVVMAYHPDSDFGPADEDHPMINRTIIDGVSASNLSNLQTEPPTVDERGRTH